MKKNIGKDTRLKGQGLDVQINKEYRCPVCRRLLMRGEVVCVETRCPKCRRIITIHK